MNISSELTKVWPLAVSITQRSDHLRFWNRKGLINYAFEIAKVWSLAVLNARRSDHLLFWTLEVLINSCYERRKVSHAQFWAQENLTRSFLFWSASKSEQWNKNFLDQGCTKVWTLIEVNSNNGVFFDLEWPDQRWRRVPFKCTENCEHTKDWSEVIWKS